jgi:hypothetical protein
MLEPAHRAPTTMTSYIRTPLVVSTNLGPHSDWRYRNIRSPPYGIRVRRGLRCQVRIHQALLNCPHRKLRP